jgi:glycerate kinase
LITEPDLIANLQVILLSDIKRCQKEIQFALLLEAEQFQYFNIEGLFDDCDLVITAEGAIDYQTPRGKIPAEVATRARKHKKPVIVLAIGDNADANYDIGINAYTSILQRPSTLDEAIDETERLLIEGAEGAMRMVMVGRTLNSSLAWRTR